MIGLFYNYYIFFQDLDPHFAYAAKVKNLLNEKKVFSYHPITLRYNKPNFTLGGGGYAVPLLHAASSNARTSISISSDFDYS